MWVLIKTCRCKVLSSEATSQRSSRRGVHHEDAEGPVSQLRPLVFVKLGPVSCFWLSTWQNHVWKKLHNELSAWDSRAHPHCNGEKQESNNCQNTPWEEKKHRKIGHTRTLLSPWDSPPGSGTSGKPSAGQRKKKEKAQTTLILYLYLSSNALSYYKLELEAFISKQK